MDIRISRRATLKLAVGAGLAAAGVAATTSCTTTGGAKSPIDRLRAAAPGRVLVANDAGYDDERAAWNLHVDHRPAVIVAATKPEHVAAAVRYAGDEDLPVGVQATGHGQATAVGDAVLVSTRGLTELRVDPRAGTARIGAGQQWGAVLDVAVPHGLASLNGSTSAVGVIGYLTGGGMPVLGRRYGFAADRVRALELVTADGDHHRTTPDREPDLFWAVRGGTSNFGIVTAAEIDLIPQPRFFGGGLFYPGDIAQDVVRDWLDWVSDQGDDMCTSLAVMRFLDLPDIPEPVRGKFLVHVRIAYAGTASQGEQLIRPLRSMRPVLDTVADRSYAQIDEVHQDPKQPVPAVESSALLRDLDAGFVEQLMAVAGPDSEGPPEVVELRLMGGAFAQRPAAPSAIGHRDAAYNLLLAALAPPGHADQARTRLSDTMTTLGPWSTGAVFPNFIGGSGHPEPARVRAAYETDDYKRLQRLKSVYDPANMFRLNHNIPPAKD